MEHLPGQPSNSILLCEYEKLNVEDSIAEDLRQEKPQNAQPNYFLFVLLGIGIIWTWNAFVGATPYFSQRFESDVWIKTHHVAAIFLSFSATSLGTVTFLTTKPGRVQYDLRAIASMAICFTVCGLLALSAFLQQNVPGHIYFIFVLLMACCMGTANALSQNGVYAFVSGLGQSKLTQATLLGSAMAGMMIPVSQIAIFHLTKTTNNSDDPWWPKLYFLLALGLSLVTLMDFTYITMQARRDSTAWTSVDNALDIEAKGGLARMTIKSALQGREQRMLAVSIFICLASSSFCPVYASRVQSLEPEHLSNIISDSTTFTAFSFLLMNIGDFCGTMLVLSRWHILHHSVILFVATIVKVAMTPLFLLCNIDGQGALFGGDVFYLVGLQGVGGLMNGWISGACLMAASRSTDKSLRETTGAIMIFCLMAGLAVGSITGILVT